MIRIFRVFVPGSILALLFSDALLLYTCYSLAAFLTLDADPQVFFRYDGGWLRIAIVTLTIMAGLYFQDLYTNIRIHSKILLIQQAGICLGAAFLFQALLVYLGRQDWFVSTATMIAGSAIGFALLPIWRVLYARMVCNTAGSERVLLLGSSRSIQEVCAHWAEHPENGFAAIGCIDDSTGDSLVPGVPLLGEIADIGSIAERERPARIVVGIPERRNRLPVDQLLDLRLSGIQVEEVAATYESTFCRISTRELRPAQLIFTGLGPNP